MTSVLYEGHAQADSFIIKEKLRELGTIVGIWETKGNLLGIEEVGTTEIFWTLDSTYLQWIAIMRIPSQESIRSYTAFITYSPISKQYVTTSFFSGTDFRMVHHKGWFDHSSKKFYREAINSFPGRGDEWVRNIIDLSEEDRFTYLSYQTRDSLEKLAFKAVYIRLR